MSWKTSEILRLISLGYLLSADSDTTDLLQKEPQLLARYASIGIATAKMHVRLSDVCPSHCASKTFTKRSRF